LHLNVKRHTDDVVNMEKAGMGVSKAAAAENRARVVEVAGRLFREKGFDGIGVSDLMKAAGLTHGGFYASFASKEDLAIQASTLALTKGVETLARVASEASGCRFAAVVQFYLTERHRDRPGAGCPLAALGADAARYSPALRAVFTQGLEAHMDLLETIMPEAVIDARREKAGTAMALMAGALMLSRSVEEKLSKQVLESAATSVLALCGPDADQKIRSDDAK
jgi:TetR/AcrR family transcriptional repressor of nem operon